MPRLLVQSHSGLFAWELDLILLGPSQLRIFWIFSVSPDLHTHSGTTLGALENLLKGAALPYTNVPRGDCPRAAAGLGWGAGRGQSGRLFPHWKLLNMKKGGESGPHTCKNGLGKHKPRFVDSLVEAEVALLWPCKGAGWNAFFLSPTHLMVLGTKSESCAEAEPSEECFPFQ